MEERTIDNPVTGERCTFIETSRETSGARSVADFEVAPDGGVPKHRHSDHEERIDVLEGEIEVTVAGVRRRCGSGEQVLFERGKAHSWRNPSADRKLRFRVTMTPGHPGFETFLRVWFGLGRDGGLRRSGRPRRFADIGLLMEWDPSLATGAVRVLAPFMKWSMRRPRARGRGAELMRLYGADDPAVARAGDL